MSITHVVKQGECLSSIAKAHGFADWRRIYDDPENVDFKQKRPSPDLIYPGDIVKLPDAVPPVIAASTGQVHVIEVDEPATSLRVMLEIAEPYAYELEAGGQVFKGQTDGKSPIEQQIAADLAEARLTAWPVWADREAATIWNFAFGHLDPIEELSGVQGRLAHLGYYAGRVDGAQSPDSDDAILRFQHDEKLDTSKGLDDPTRTRLRKRHDGL